MRICRFRFENKILWGIVRNDHLVPIQGNHIIDFLNLGGKSPETNGNPIEISKVEILSPITSPCNIICQGKNYAQHIIETGMNPKDKDYNLFFTKASSSLTSAIGDIIKPSFVKLLDYEAEMVLVLKKEILKKTIITKENLHEYVGAITLANDVSARDIQIPQGQWFKGKSYRTFCPIGPFVQLVGKEDVTKIPKLRISLNVNGELRQNSTLDKMIFPPEETLTELSEIMDLFPGDIILTGTPSGVALNAPGGFIKRIASFLFSEKKLMEIFVRKQLSSPKYLKVGDRIEAELKTEDGSLDLGKMKLKVKEEN
ncbi:fumarylacetoacetate hydrolase family protein [Leptospira haakeii]|uniref:Fumarylacetoacetate hydrolase n=1 Tax=Leptospira haakeii TaxID=2023198 RepID=A0ABX4PRM2_9LEPT|nr:fumarylacetoacetate hydrolase family protein [Leptospira haakeii]PKA17475.1 fumarylacetoacetate hydrolase [Leptospira haakeii]PKA21199.1 fumarylacetoacetate hydrolase [Leptospira haakeii]